MKYTHLLEVYFRLHGLVFSARNGGRRADSSHQTFRGQCLSPFPSQISPSSLRLPGSYRPFPIDLRHQRLFLPLCSLRNSKQFNLILQQLTSTGVAAKVLPRTTRRSNIILPKGIRWSLQRNVYFMYIYIFIEYTS